MKKKQTYIGLYILVILLITSAIYIWYVSITDFDIIYSDHNGYYSTPEIVFEQYNSSTIIVIETDTNLTWNNIRITGNATLPEGLIQKGDIITNCSGLVRLIWFPSNIEISSFEFN